jgi:hypothetical protein
VCRKAGKRARPAASGQLVQELEGGAGDGLHPVVIAGHGVDTGRLGEAAQDAQARIEAGR